MAFPRKSATAGLPDWWAWTNSSRFHVNASNGEKQAIRTGGIQRGAEITQLTKKKTTNKLTTADIKMEMGELCNFVCSVKYWCFLRLLSLPSIDVPDLWLRWREHKSPTPEKKRREGNEMSLWCTAKTGSSPAERDVAEAGPGSLQEGRAWQLVLSSLAKDAGWNSQPEMPAAQHLHWVGVLQHSLKQGCFRGRREPQLLCSQGWKFSATQQIYEASGKHPLPIICCCHFNLDVFLLMHAKR